MLFEIEERLMQEIINYLVMRPFIEVHKLLAEINPFIAQHAEKQKEKEEKKDADNTGS